MNPDFGFKLRKPTNPEIEMQIEGNIVPYLHPNRIHFTPHGIQSWAKAVKNDAYNDMNVIVLKGKGQNTGLKGFFHCSW